MKLGFYQKSIVIAGISSFIIIFFIVCLIVYSYHLKKEWPPSISPCPDWWKSIGQGKCLNQKGMGSCNKKIMNFNESVFKGSEGLCAKYTWAKNCNISWDGITYGVPNPC